jgi:acetyl-CoA carboxylase biotin carboxyl carrier protein
MKSKIDHEEIIRLIDLLEARKLSHFELEVEGFKISIGRSLPPSILPEIAAVTDSSVPVPPGEAAAPEDRPAGDQQGLKYISSPMVGTFYRAPDPSAPTFVEVGDSVTKNQTLCIIEAMKLMNEIEADVEGVVEEILVKNGKPVEYGQKLFAIRSL